MKKVWGNTATAVEGGNQSYWYWKPFSNKTQKNSGGLGLSEKPWVFANPGKNETLSSRIVRQALYITKYV